VVTLTNLSIPTSPVNSTAAFRPASIGSEAELQVVIRLREDWVCTQVEVHDVVHVVGAQYTSVDPERSRLPELIIDAGTGLLIVQPDCLISGKPPSPKCVNSSALNRLWISQAL